jgi:hypothetical protein
MGSGFPLRPSKWNTKQPIPRPFPKLVLVLVYVDGEILQKFGYAFVAGQEKKNSHISVSPSPKSQFVFPRMALRGPTARPLANDSWGMLGNALQRFERRGERGGKGVILATPLRKRSVMMCSDSSLLLGVFSC